MRSTPAQDERLRARLREAIDKFADGSTDEFGRLIEYKNGGYIREILRLEKPKPVRDALIYRVHTHGAAKQPGLKDWFAECLSPITTQDLVPSAPAVPPTPWPFRRLSIDRWKQLDREDAAVAEDAYLSKLRELEVERQSGS